MAESRVEQVTETGSYALLDILVGVLIVALVAFLIVTMGIRTKATELEDECQTRLVALAQAQQAFLIKNGNYSDDLPGLRPFLDAEDRGIPFSCPITGNDFQVRVQGDRYKIIAPGTEFYILTGDPSW